MIGSTATREMQLVWRMSRLARQHLAKGAGPLAAVGKETPETAKSPLVTHKDRNR